MIVLNPIVVSIDQHMFSLIVNLVWSSCSVIVVNTPLMKYVYLLKDNSNLFFFILVV